MNFDYRVEDCKEDSGKVCVWIGSQGYVIDREDLGAFLDHMEDWYDICGRVLSREEYEGEYSRLGLGEVRLDDDLGQYADIYGDYGMDHYHTIPEHRGDGIRGELDQGRWRGILRETPDILEQRKQKRIQESLDRELSKSRESWPSDLDKYIEDIGGYESLYEGCKKAHSNNSVQLREEGLHFEWLIGHQVLHMAIEASYGHPEYRAPETPYGDVYFPYSEMCEWWADWSSPHLLVPEHPLRRIAERFSDRRIEPYKGRVKYFGYGEDDGDDVRRNVKALFD